MPEDRLPDLLSALRRGAAAVPAAQLLAALQISQPTLSRLVQRAGLQVLRIGKARATRYALTRSLARLGSHWPLYRIDENGGAHTLGVLHVLARDAWYFDAHRAAPALLHGEFQLGLYPGLPWFLDDQRPQGFLGRALARAISPQIGASTDLKVWQADDLALAVLLESWDGPGDLLIGEANLQRAQHARIRPDPLELDLAQRELRYPELAADALRGEAVGSSAGGEQPKFTVTLRDEAGALPVIVKFSDRNDSRSGQRWADLLRCEHLAGEVLREHGLPAAHSEIVQADGRCFLQSRRFDRTASGGRRGMVSLAALDAAHYGHGRIDWWRWAPQLQADGWLNRQCAQQLAQLGWFGDLIGNSDMHLGNAALLLREHRPLELAPAYDMLPMRYSPRATGEVVDLPVPDFSLPTPEQLANWRSAADMAAVFWNRVQLNAQISANFKQVARVHAEQLERVRAALAAT